MIIAKIATAFALALTAFPTSNAVNPVSRLPETEKQTMLDAVNRLRAKGCHCGRKYMPPVGPVRWNAKLEKAALAHAKDMDNHQFFSHTGSDGSSIGKRATKSGYQWRAVGENIAAGYGSFHHTLMAWKDSPGHCRNLMNGSYTEMGIAELNDLWVQDFGAPQVSEN